MGKIQLLQLDSVPVIIRTQYMPAFSRLGVYDTSLLDELAYKRDEWFEAFVHEASLLPVEDEPLLRFFKTRAAAGDTWRGLYELAQRETGYIDEVLAEVTDRGPLKTSELSSPRPRDGEWWGSRSVGALALDWLFRIGAVGIRRVGNFEKEFDLLDRIVPASVRAKPTPTPEESMKELLVRSAQALGLGTAGCLVDYYRLPKRPSRPLIAELVEDGRLESVSVGGRDAYLDPRASLPRAISGRALLSPFDPVVWNRDRASWLFDFEYRIEIYVPKNKRIYGYYVLPFLLNGKLVARCDLKTDRFANTLRLLGAFAEKGVGNEIASELAAELLALSRLVGVDDVTVEATGSLAREVRTALTR